MISEKLAEYGRRRRLAQKVKAINNIGDTDSGIVLDELKDIYTSELPASNESGDMKACFSGFDQRVKENMAHGTLGIPTGFDKFDDLDIDYEPGHCWAYGGYTNVGKTALMIEQIIRIFEAGGDIPKMSIHSTEMKRHQLIARLLAGMTGISHKLILRGKPSQSIDHARHVIFKSGLKIYDINRDFDVFCNQCRKDKLQDGLDLVWADYLQNFKRKGLKGYDLMSELGKDSLALPQELDMTLFMLSQISTSEFKEDSGGLAFKGAGELGESCDIGLWLSRSKTVEYGMLVEHRKNRHGGKKDFVLKFQPNSNRLSEVFNG
jgi:replicative DNA helicase